MSTINTWAEFVTVRNTTDLSYKYNDKNNILNKYKFYISHLYISYHTSSPSSS